MRRVNLMVLLAVGLTSHVAAQTTRPAVPDVVGRVVHAAHESGYREGYLAGVEAARGGERLQDCDRLLNQLEQRANAATAYESCLKKLEFATTQGASYLRDVANECVSKLPPMVR